MPEVYEVGYNHSTTDVTVTTTTETVAISSPEIKVPFQTARLLVMAWAQVTTGTGATALTARIRRGTTTSGALVGEANAETLKAAAGGTEPVFIIVQEDQAGVDSVQYSLTVQQTGATGDGTVLQAAILVLVM